MNSSDRKKIQQTISLLQQVLGQKSGSGPSPVPNVRIPGFDQQIKIFTNISQTLQPGLKDTTKVIIEALSFMQNIINYSQVCKPFTQQQKQALSQKYVQITKKIDPIDRQKQNFDFINHIRAVRQLLNVPYWVFTNTPQFIIKSGIQSADFHAIKFMKLKNQAHNDWWKSIGKAFRAIEQLTKKQYKMGLNFSNSGSHSWSQIISGNTSSNNNSQQQQIKPAQQNVQQPIQQNIVKKTPKKQLQGFNWFIGNFNNEKISISPNQIQMKNGVFIQNCKSCTIQILGKFKSLSMTGSSDITLVVSSCVSGLQIMNGNDIKIYVKQFSPSISVDKCTKVRVVLNSQNMNCQILTSKTTQINISYDNNGNQSKAFMVAQQLITKWNPTKNKFETVIYDKFL